MPKGKHVQSDLECMVKLVIKERRIALPAARLWWYARWFKLPSTRQNFTRVLRDMVRRGDLVVTMDGGTRYYKRKVK